MTMLQKAVVAVAALGTNAIMRVTGKSKTAVWRWIVSIRSAGHRVR